MELTHTFTVPAPIDKVWETFMDLEQVGGCFPGATVTSVEDNSFTGSVKVKLGPIAMVYKGSGEFVERDDAAHRAKIEAKGKDKRGNGTAGADVSVQLTEDGSGTRAEVITDLSVTGKPAQFGRGVMQDVSDKLLAQFVSCIEDRLTGGSDDSTETGSGAPTVGTAAQSSPAAGAAAAVAPSVAADAVNSKGSPALGADASHAASSRSREEALDLGGAVGPVIAKQAAPYAGGLLALLLGGWVVNRLLGRRTRCPRCAALER